MTNKLQTEQDESGHAGNPRIIAAEEALVRVKEEAQTQQRLFDTILNNTPDLIYVFDKQYRFTYANTALLAMWGKTAEEAIGKGLRSNGYEEWHALMHEREIDQVVATRQPVRGTVSFGHATLGKRVYDYIFVPVLDSDGQVEAIAGTTRDITDITLATDGIRESETRFRNLADESPMFVFIIEPGPEAPVSYWNRTWLQYTGQTDHEALGRAWDGIIHPDDIELVMAHYSPAFQHQEAYFIPAVRVKRFDDMYRWHAFKGNPRYAPDGTFNGYVGVGFDIDEQKKAEEIIRRSEAELQQKVLERTRALHRSNEDLQQFAHVASHDLKEPVRKILMFSNRMRKDVDRLPADIQSYIQKIETSAERVFAMINGILQYSSLHSQDIEVKSVDLQRIMEDIEEDFELSIGDQRATLIYQNLPAVPGSDILIHQLFYNLINNALKFSFPERPAVIQVEAAMASEEDSAKAGLPGKITYRKITVSDNGIGFDQEDAGIIFQSFLRLNNRDRYEGTGLGLALCQKIAERHHGAIYAEGQKGNGARFIVLLPP